MKDDEKAEKERVKEFKGDTDIRRIVQTVLKQNWLKRIDSLDVEQCVNLLQLNNKHKGEAGS